MFVVYWLERTADNDHDDRARFERFDADQLAEALRFANTLRESQAASGEVSFVSLCSENPQSVGRAGVADPPADYDWKKRR